MKIPVDIRKTIKKLFFYQGLLLLVTGVISLALVSVVFAKKRIQERISRLEVVHGRMVAQLERGELPAGFENADNFLVYIIDKNRGEVVVERQSSMGMDAGNDLLWESHKSKLIYQMQKQRRGTIRYPLRQAWEIWFSQKIIRYAAIDQWGWIVAMEAELPPFFSVLRDGLSSRVLGIFFMTIAAGMILSRFIIYAHFLRIQKSLSEALENNLLNLTGENIWDQFRKPEESDAASEPSHALPLKTQPPSSPAYTDVAMEFTPPPRAPERSGESREPINNVPPPEQVHKAATADVPKYKKNAYDDLTINISHVKSPLLKQMLSELRKKAI